MFRKRMMERFCLDSRGSETLGSMRGAALTTKSWLASLLLTLACACLLGGCAEEPSALEGNRSELHDGSQDDSLGRMDDGIYTYSEEDIRAEVVKLIANGYLDNPNKYWPSAVISWDQTETIWSHMTSDEQEAAYSNANPETKVLMDEAIVKTGGESWEE